jgi:hypothetical protein
MVDDGMSQKSEGIRTRRAITLRSVLLGLAGTVVISALAPYNDLALNNTYLIGSYLPIALVSILFLLAVLVNGPLSRWAPRWALTTPEVAVMFVMVLVSCAVPANGLMRYWVPSLVAPLWHAQTNPEFHDLLVSFDLPSWLFPSFPGDSMEEWIRDPIVTGFVDRWTEESPPPYLAWVQPALTWGVFIFAFYGAMISLITLVHHQWYENERLAFPLATVQLALVEQPEPGRYFNRVFGRRSFWVAFVAVFSLHLLSGGSQYWPGTVPAVPLSYDFHGLFADPPLVYTDTQFKEAYIYFSIVGVAYFISTPVAFSLWFFFILRQFHRMAMGGLTGEGHPLGEWDLHAGGLIAYTLIAIWIGRRHWRTVLGQAFRRPREGEPTGRYLSHRSAFWGFVGCAGVMMGFLWLAGCGVGGSICIVLLLLMLMFTLTRIVAETGLIQGQLLFQLFRPFQVLLMSGWAPVSTKSFYFASMLHMTFYDAREAAPIYAAHGFKVADKAVHNDRPSANDTREDRRFGRKLILLMFLALGVAYFTGLSSMLWTEYNHGVTLDATGEAPINAWPVRWMSAGMMNETLRYDRGAVHSPFNPWWFLGGGFIITVMLAVMRLQFVWWPLHPVGFVMMPTGPVLLMWFSIFLAWLVKSLVVRFGGNTLYQDLKPFFLGLIVGEAGAAGFWLLVAFVLSYLGMSYEKINILPY